MKIHLAITRKKRLVKLVIGLLLVSTVIFFVASTGIWLFLPREEVKAAAVKELSKRLNQDVSIKNISVGFYPDFELVAAGVRVTDRETGRELASAQRVRLDVSLYQLLRRKFVLQDVVLNSPELNMVREQDGIWNTERMRRSMKGDGGSEGKSLSFHISPIRIHRGTVHIRDDRSHLELNIDDINATLDVQNQILTIHSAELSLPFMKAKYSGTVSEFAVADPALLISAELHLTKDGPLADLTSGDLRPHAPVADVSLEISGRSKNLLMNADFSLNPAITAGMETQGTLTGRLRPNEAALQISALDASMGKSTVSLSGALSDIWSDAREGRIEGKGKLLLEEISKIIGEKSSAAFHPDGVAAIDFAVQGEARQLDIQTKLDLVNAGLTVPQLMRKEPGAPGALNAHATFIPPGDLVIDTFTFILGDSKVEGNARLSPSAKPWASVSMRSTDFSLKELNLIPSVSFRQGNLLFTASASQTNPGLEETEFAGEGVVENASIATDFLTEPVRNLYASFAVRDNRASADAASFSFGTSTFHANAEIQDIRNLHITGSVRTRTLNVNELVDAVKKQANASDSPSPAENAKPDALSLSLLVEADSVYAGSFRTGPVSTVWTFENKVHKFDPLTLESFGGTIKGNFVLDASNETTSWSAQFDGRKMKLEQLMAQLQPGKAKVTGDFEAKGQLSGPVGGTKEEMLRGICGQVDFTAEKGEIKQYTLLKNIFLLMQLPVGTLLIPGVREVMIANTLFDAAKTRGRSLDPNNIAYEKIKGSFSVSQGTAHTDSLCLESGVADLLFAGNIDIPQNQMDMTVRATPLGSIGSVMNSIPIAGKELKKMKDAVLSTDFIVRGPVSDPDVHLKVAEKLLGKEEKEK